jgi:hypothetical protein
VPVSASSIATQPHQMIVCVGQKKNKEAKEEKKLTHSFLDADQDQELDGGIVQD